MRKTSRQTAANRPRPSSLSSVRRRASASSTSKRGAASTAARTSGWKPVNGLIPVSMPGVRRGLAVDVERRRKPPEAVADIEEAVVLEGGPSVLLTRMEKTMRRQKTPPCRRAGRATVSLITSANVGVVARRRPRHLKRGPGRDGREPARRDVRFEAADQRHRALGPRQGENGRASAIEVRSAGRS